MLNKKTRLVIRNFKKFEGFLWKSDPLAKVCQNNPKHPKVSLDQLTSLRIHNHNNNIVSYLNIINSIRNKVDELIGKNVATPCIVETKFMSLSNSTVYQNPYRLDICDKQ